MDLSKPRGVIPVPRILAPARDLQKSTAQQGTGPPNLPRPGDKPIPIPQQATSTTAFQDLILRFSEFFIGPNNWFSPALPIAPVVNTEFPPLWQYPVGYNLTYQPRSTELTSFDQLRYFARNYDVLATVINRKIAVLSGLKWTIKTRPDVPSEPYRDQIRVLSRFFERPDGENDWQRWVGQLMRDRFEIDALSIFVNRTKGGTPYALEQIDGAHVKPLLDYRGKVPVAPLSGYEVIYHGVPRSLLTNAKLIYRPQNLHIDSPYGLSETEMILLIVNMAMRKRISDLAHYTDSNIPAGLLGFPDTWSAEQMRQWMEQFDERMAGNLQNRSRLVPVPMGTSGGVPVHEFNEFTGDPQFDDWLAKAVIAVHNMTPAEYGMTDDVNRSTGDSQENVMYRTSIKPNALFLAGIMNYIIQDAKFFNAPDLVLEFNMGEQEDKFAEAQTYQTFFQMGTMTTEEIREQVLGLPPFGLPPAIMVNGQLMSVEQAAEMLSMPYINPMTPPGAPGGPPIDPNAAIGPAGDPGGTGGDEASGVPQGYASYQDPSPDQQSGSNPESVAKVDTAYQSPGRDPKGKGHEVVIHGHPTFLDDQGKYHLDGAKKPGVDPTDSEFLTQLREHLASRVDHLGGDSYIHHTVVRGENDEHHPLDGLVKIRQHGKAWTLTHERNGKMISEATIRGDVTAAHDQARNMVASDHASALQAYAVRHLNRVTKDDGIEKTAGDLRLLLAPMLTEGLALVTEVVMPNTETEPIDWTSTTSGDVHVDDKPMSDLEVQYQLARDDIRRWRTMAVKSLKANKVPRTFTSPHIPTHIYGLIASEMGKLTQINGPDRAPAASAIFARAIDILTKAQSASNGSSIIEGDDDDGNPD